MDIKRLSAAQAIETKYLGPTDTKGARVVARCDGGRLVVSWKCEHNPTVNHAMAAMALAERLGWVSSRIPAHIGGTRGGFVVVFTQTADPGSDPYGSGWTTQVS